MDTQYDVQDYLFDLRGFVILKQAVPPDLQREAERADIETGDLAGMRQYFEQALARHQPLPYDGPVYMLCSRQRSRACDPADWRKLFTGRLKRFEAGATHADALDPRNPVFAS